MCIFIDILKGSFEKFNLYRNLLKNEFISK